MAKKKNAVVFFRIEARSEIYDWDFQDIPEKSILRTLKEIKENWKNYDYRFADNLSVTPSPFLTVTIIKQ